MSYEFLDSDISHKDKLAKAFDLMTHHQIVSCAARFAESVLPIFESNYPNDNRPRKAIEAALAFAADPSKVNEMAAYAAANAAYAASYSAAHAASYAAAHANAANAAHAAATNAAYAASYSAMNAAHAAANAAYAAADAANAAAHAAANAAFLATSAANAATKAATNAATKAATNAAYSAANQELIQIQIIKDVFNPAKPSTAQLKQMAREWADAMGIEIELSGN